MHKHINTSLERGRHDIGIVASWHRENGPNGITREGGQRDDSERYRGVTIYRTYLHRRSLQEAFLLSNGTTIEIDNLVVFPRISRVLFRVSSAVLNRICSYFVVVTMLWRISLVVLIREERILQQAWLVSVERPGVELAIIVNKGSEPNLPYLRYWIMTSMQERDG